jgi:hypothetical protein
MSAPLCFRYPCRTRFILLIFLFVLPSFLPSSLEQRAHAQSTFGSVLGTVKDSSGKLVSGATVTLINTGTSARRAFTTNASGDYVFNNLDIGQYQVRVEAAGFETSLFNDLDLQAREVKRVDAELKLGTVTNTVSVEGSFAGVITTDVSSIAAVETGNELVDLPVAIYSHSQGSTSPIYSITTQPQVQVDDSGDFAVAGTTPGMMSYTLDGISSVGVEFSGPLTEMFPSFGSISEMRISMVDNNAEYGGVADVTTTSKAGTNSLHGGIFENLENTVLNAGNPFTGSTPKLIMNNFGAYGGGPVILPHLYNGRDRTFFFASYEGLRLPSETPLDTSVPTLAMRSGNICSYLGGQGLSQVYNYDGTPLDCAHIRVNATATAVMNTLMPLPNTGSADSYTYNYAVNFPSPISTNQGDLRFDEIFSNKQNMFVRYNYKSRRVTVAPSTDCVGYCNTSGSPLTGGFQEPEIDTGLTLAYNYVFNPSLINEFRGGFTLLRASVGLNVNTAQLLEDAKIGGIPDINYSAVSTPNVQVSGFMNTGGAGTANSRGKIIQFLDNVTWQKSNHTMKFGATYILLHDHDDNVFANYRSGQFNFDSSSNIGSVIGDPFTSFLLGYPDYSTLAEVNDPNMDGRGSSWAFYGQDDWKVTHRLTLNFGLRWEVHPPLKEAHGNSATFLGDYSAGGVNGAVVVPNAAALGLTNADFAASIAPTPILTAQQAHIPSRLRYTDMTDWGPRVGFAWRLDGSGKTVLRGGWGRFIDAPLGIALNDGWAVSASYVPTFSQDYNIDGTPILAFPSAFPSNISQSGASSFYSIFPIQYSDPTVQQWNLTGERDLGHNMGLRLSYTGSHGSKLETNFDLNQVQPNTLGYAAVAANRPYPLWDALECLFNSSESNYNAATVDVSRRMTNGLQFESSYVWTRDLSDAGGNNPSSFASAGGDWGTNRFHPGLDYGNVSYDRQHRFLTTFLYELPFGRGKAFLPSTGALLDRVVSGWQLSGVVIFQSGPFLTPYEQSTDPAGTNIQSVVGDTRTDILPNAGIYSGRGTSVDGNPVWLNANAFPIPASNIGRFGNAPVGSVVGPGTENFSIGLLKSTKLTERADFLLGIQVANLFNRRNYEPPSMQVDAGGFGQISALQTAEGAGPRTAQITARITF